MLLCMEEDMITIENGNGYCSLVTFREAFFVNEVHSNQ